MTNFESYFDPDNHLNGPDDYGVYWDQIQAEIKKHDSGRWDVVDCCVTGKYSDLDKYGQQGYSLTDINDDHVWITIKCGKTFPGTDVSLNLPPEVEDDEELYEAAMTEYLDQAQEVMCGVPFPGDWSGEDWYIYHEQKVKVPYFINDETGDLDVEKTMNAIHEAFDKTVEDWDREISFADEILGRLAGWVTNNESENDNDD